MRAAAACWSSDAELTAEWIRTSLLPVLTNIDQVAGMSEAASALGRKDADRWLAKAVIDIVAAERRPGPAGPGRAPPPAGRPPRPPGPPGRPAQPAAPASGQGSRPGRSTRPAGGRRSADSRAGPHRQTR